MLEDVSWPSSEPWAVSVSARVGCGHGTMASWFVCRLCYVNLWFNGICIKKLKDKISIWIHITTLSLWNTSSSVKQALHHRLKRLCRPGDSSEPIYTSRKHVRLQSYERYWIGSMISQFVGLCKIPWPTKYIGISVHTYLYIRIFAFRNRIYR